MNTISRFFSVAFMQLKDLWKALMLLYAPIAGLFLIVGILVIEDASLAFFLRDVVATAKLPFFAGFVSQLAGILWSAAVTICLFSAIIMSRRPVEYTKAKRLFLHGGILTCALLLDDVFLFHEVIAPKYLHISEKFVMLGYLILGAAFVYLNWNQILASEYAILLLAVILFGTSIFLDTLPIKDYHLRYFWEQLELFIEDGTKFAGIATWLMYFAREILIQIET